MYVISTFGIILTIFLNKHPGEHLAKVSLRRGDASFKVCDPRNLHVNIRSFSKEVVLIYTSMLC